MDSITQAALGATVAAVVAGKRCSGKVLVVGALLGTLPDLDVLISYGNDVSNTVKHRGFTHSLLVLPLFSVLLTLFIQRLRPVPGWSFWRLLLLISTTLITHPVLDFFTTYGTQLTWPIPGYYALSSIFIIDPLYTLPLLIALGIAICKPATAARVCAIALTLSTLYLGWSLIAQQIIKTRVEQSLQRLGIAYHSAGENVLITPTPFNTILWRIVVLDGNDYLEGLVSLLDNTNTVLFSRHSRGEWPLPDRPKLLQDLTTFSHDFISYQEENRQLIVSDLRMGMENNLAFRFTFATRDAWHQWQLQTPSRYEGIRLDGDFRKLIHRLLGRQHTAQE